MADTTLLLNGFSIIGDPQTNSNASGGGELMIHDGEAVFEEDDIVVIHVTNVDPDGTLNDNSVVTSIVIYDNASDYYNDIPLYTYTGTADIDAGRNNMGDRYLEFDASGLTSTDSGAPVLDELAMVAGVNILDALASQNGPFEVPTNEDIDLDGDGIISPEEQADGSFSSELNILALICFCAGTLIETPTGPQAIETLKEGDLVNTLDAGAQPIRWIGGNSTEATGPNAPVWIRAGALGNVRDLWVSQNHRMLLTGAQAELLFGQSQVLVAAKHLVNDKTIHIVPGGEVEYWHFLLDDHQIVFAEACPSESLFPGQQALKSVPDQERDEIVTLFPELAENDAPGPLARYALKAYEARLFAVSA
ncbi:Hint domain-containing protein [Alisedimentitalea sp. MJ-SS2]|uniref:Hint domain-containing protein n=1 Tax=Aliisedimentitalea sp. MJ-SS2 TaxID=3049795 RepID=UPI00290C8E74|nr:Hint domain-containing protein [Alisedimentitalea sp. MJ-SS2]MDU8927166.1 Hint domain-containing protein [Alisedimentitalea sp. MJ-SS2]